VSSGIEHRSFRGTGKTATSAESQAEMGAAEFKAIVKDWKNNVNLDLTFFESRILASICTHELVRKIVEEFFF
jgi:hypothetical protein